MVAAAAADLAIGDKHEMTREPAVHDARRDARGGRAPAAAPGATPLQQRAVVHDGRRGVPQNVLGAPPTAMHPLRDFAHSIPVATHTHAEVSGSGDSGSV